MWQIWIKPCISGLSVEVRYFPLLWLEALDGFLTSSVQCICMPKGVLEGLGEIHFLHMAGCDCNVVIFLSVMLTGHSW